MKLDIIWSDDKGQSNLMNHAGFKISNFLKIKQAPEQPDSQFGRAASLVLELVLRLRSYKMVTIDGKIYIEKSTDDLPFGNVCQKCVFYKTPCYNRNDFSCHSDERSDGKDIIFIRAEKELQLNVTNH